MIAELDTVELRRFRERATEGCDAKPATGTRIRPAYLGALIVCGAGWLAWILYGVGVTYSRDIHPLPSPLGGIFQALLGVTTIVVAVVAWLDRQRRESRDITRTEHAALLAAVTRFAERLANVEARFRNELRDARDEALADGYIKGMADRRRGESRNGSIRPVP